MIAIASRKVLVPLTTMLAAGAVAVGSGATWTSSSDAAISASAGDLVHENSEDTATLTITDLKPGETETGELTITNTGSLDSTLELVPSNVEDGFLDGDVSIKIEATDDGETTTAYAAGDFDGLTSDLALGDLDADAETPESITVTFTVSMASDADTANQGESATVDLEFVTTQTTDEEAETEWVEPEPETP